MKVVKTMLPQRCSGAVVLATTRAVPLLLLTRCDCIRYIVLSAVEVGKADVKARSVEKWSSGCVNKVSRRGPHRCGQGGNEAEPGRVLSLASVSLTSVTFGGTGP